MHCFILFGSSSPSLKVTLKTDFHLHHPQHTEGIKTKEKHNQMNDTTLNFKLHIQKHFSNYNINICIYPVQILYQLFS